MADWAQELGSAGSGQKASDPNKLVTRRELTLRTDILGSCCSFSFPLWDMETVCKQANSCSAYIKAGTPDATEHQTP